jgi:hypothetical protein
MRGTDQKSLIILVGKPERSRPLARTSRRLDDNIKIGVK